jgi:hypothetical protein
MRTKSILVGCLVVLVTGLSAVQSWAFPSFARDTKLACVTCHANPAGGAALSDSGKAYLATKKAPAASTAKAAEYVGTNKCKMCHSKEYTSWKEMPHGMAMAGLQKADPKFAADLAAKLKVELKAAPAATDECVMCHVTGFHLPGGYPAADSAKTAAVTNVACEACHGPGSLHVAAPLAEKKNFISRAVGAKMCMQCHTADTSPKFNFEEYKKKAMHAVKAAG